MNKKQYEEKRQKLMNEAQNLINQGKADAAESKMAEITALDEEWDGFAQMQANFNALNKEPKEMNPFRCEEQMDSYPVGIRYEDKQGNVFLNNGDSLSSRVMNNMSKETAVLSTPGMFGEVIKGMVTGEWKDNTLKNAATTTATGVLIPEILSSRIIDKARNLSLFTQAGVPVIAMESNNVTVSRVKTDPVFRFKKEAEEAEESNFELDGVTLKAKTCYGYVYVSLEAIKSSVNLEDILLPVFAGSIAQAMDEGMLYGQYNTVTSAYEAFAPSGIMNDADINILTAGENDGYDIFLKAFGRIKKANGNPKVVGINSETEEMLSLLKSTEGQYLMPPKAFEDVEKVVSNQLMHDEADGSDALVFDPNAMLIGIQNNITIKIIEDGECLKKGLVGFQIYSMIDCKTTVPKHICRIKGIK